MCCNTYIHNAAVSSSLCLLRLPPAFQYLYPKRTVPNMPIFMFAINTLYQFLLFTLSCILCIPFIFCFSCNFANAEKNIYNSTPPPPPTHHTHTHWRAHTVHTHIYTHIHIHTHTKHTCIHTHTPARASIEGGGGQERDGERGGERCSCLCPNSLAIHLPPPQKKKKKKKKKRQKSTSAACKSSMYMKSDMKMQLIILLIKN